MLMAAALALSMCIPAFAAESPVTSVALTSTYTLVGNASDGVSPETEFTYSIEKTSVANQAGGITLANMPVPTFDGGVQSITFTRGEATQAGETKSLQLNLPEYTGVGVYTYTVTQQAGNLEGVTYNSGSLVLTVTVTNHTKTDESDTQLFDCYVAIRESGSDTKLDSIAFENTYGAATLNVKKVVTGVSADKSRSFDFTVTFTKEDGTEVPDVQIEQYVAGIKNDSFLLSWTDNTATASFQLSDGKTATFTNLPYGVTYKVEETAAAGYTTTYANQENTAGAVDFEQSIEAVVTNTSIDGTVDTGVNLDNAPYLLLLAAVAAAAVAFVVMKSKKHDDDDEA